VAQPTNLIKIKNSEEIWERSHAGDAVINSKDGRSDMKLRLYAQIGGLLILRFDFSTNSKNKISLSAWADGRALSRLRRARKMITSDLGGGIGHRARAHRLVARVFSLRMRAAQPHSFANWIHEPIFPGGELVLAKGRVVQIFVLHSKTQFRKSADWISTEFQRPDHVIPCRELRGLEV
jgi:hypothetical protein